jgi:hypothetical protein
MKRCAIFFATVIVLVLFTKALAVTYSMEPTADARVINISGFQNNNYVNDILSCYTDSSGLNTQRTFIQFDLSGITLTSTQIVQSATLTLIASIAYGTNTDFQPMEIYRVVAPWTETGLTWLNRDATHPWTTPGGDFVGLGGQPYSISTVSPTNGQPVTWDVTALVQEWVSHASTNCGLLLKSESGNHLTFNQREIPTAALRPNLTVVVGGGLPPLMVSRSGGQFILSWTSANAVLQEKTNLNAAVAWQDSDRTVVPANGTNSVTIPVPTGNNFFRLRLGP